MPTDKKMATLSALDISVARHGRQLLHAVTMHVQAGEVVGLIGPNGAGKSTLLSVMAGLDKPQRGDVYLSGKRLASIDRGERAQALGYLEQQATVHWPMSVESIVSLGRMPHMSAWQSMQEDDKAAVNRALLATDCEDFRKQSVLTLSGGELTRVMLARALAAEPTLLLADEPVAALDVGHQLQIMEYLREFAVDQRAVVVVLHDLSLAARYCDQIYLLHEGRLQAQGTPADVLTEDMLRDVYGVEVTIGCDQVPWIVPVKRVN